MPVGKKDESAHCVTQKAPELRPPGFFCSVITGWIDSRPEPGTDAVWDTDSPKNLPHIRSSDMLIKQTVTGKFLNLFSELYFLI